MPKASSGPNSIVRFFSSMNVSASAFEYWAIDAWDFSRRSLRWSTIGGRPSEKAMPAWFSGQCERSPQFSRSKSSSIGMMSKNSM